MALRKLLAVGPQDHGQVREVGNRQAQRLVDQNLTGRVRQMVVAADDMRDLHVRVIAHHGEVVRGRAIRAHDDHVVHDVGRELRMTVYGVVECDGAVVVGNLQAPDMGFAGRNTAGCLVRIEAAARAVVSAIGLAVFLGCLALCIQLLFRAEAGIHGTALLQRFEGLFVRIEAFGLTVRAVRAADLGALVPIKAQPLHGADDDTDVLIRRALGVGVLDAQDELAAHRAGEGPVEDSGTGAAQMQFARGRRCKAHAYLRICSFSHSLCVPFRSRSNGERHQAGDCGDDSPHYTHRCPEAFRIHANQQRIGIEGPGAGGKE